MREKIYRIIRGTNTGDKRSKYYNIFMVFIILLSLVPIAFKVQTPLLDAIDYVTAAIYVIDYFLRLITADYKLKKGAKSFFIYPFTPLAIIDLISILPSINLLNETFRLLRIVRLMQVLKVLRFAKFIRHSKNMELVTTVIKKQRKPLLCVCSLAVAYILLSALVVFNVEPDTYSTFYDAVYWATVSLTTLGYGDIYPVTALGRLVTMLSAVFGIAVIALPSGIITAGYMQELSERQDSKKESEE